MILPPPEARDYHIACGEIVLQIIVNIQIRAVKNFET